LAVVGDCAHDRLMQVRELLLWRKKGHVALSTRQDYFVAACISFINFV
jgi:hypothetical protein